MSINDPRIQIATAVQPIEPVSTRKGTTFRAPVYDASNARRQVYLKLLRTEDIAREALCAVLARVVGLPIAQAFYVYVEPIYVPGHQTGNNDKIAFGLEQEHYPTFRMANDQIDDAVRRWPEALPCGVFDEWIFNGDRLPKNLLFARNGVYWMIDHDEALPNSAAVSDVCNSQILRVLCDGKSEFELHKLRRDALMVVDRFKNIDWSALPNLVIPPDLAMSNIGTHVEKYINFLRQRIEHMPEILTRSLNIKQLDMRLDEYSVPVDREKKKS
ncbi:MAG: hypothetical protein Q7L19_03685 [Pseudohongiella sp.]|nr:hypothetical protein [Pseudohongiella sp.]